MQMVSDSWFVVANGITRPRGSFLCFFSYHQNHRLSASSTITSAEVPIYLSEDIGTQV